MRRLIFRRTLKKRRDQRASVLSPLSPFNAAKSFPVRKARRLAALAARARALAVKSRDVFSRGVVACLSRRALSESECAYSRLDGTIEPANKTHFRLHVRIIPDYTYTSDSTAHYGLTGIPAIQFMYRLVNSLPGNNYIDVIQCALRPSARHRREHCAFAVRGVSVVTRNDEAK